MKSGINQMAHGTIDTNDTNSTKLNATYAINATCTMCQTTILENE